MPRRSGPATESKPTFILFPYPRVTLPMTIDIAIIPVAGHGTRLLPATKSQPKEMLSVGRKPVVQYVVEELGLSGIRGSVRHLARKDIDRAAF